MSSEQKSAVYILGAGASKEVKLPIGNELKKIIAKLLDIRYEHGYQQKSGDDQIASAFRLIGQASSPPLKDINPYLYASWKIRDAMPQAMSIDNFIDAHVEDQLIARAGKLAIVKSILEAEKASLLHVDRSSSKPTINFSNTENTWYNAFFQLLTENCRKGDIAKRLEQIAIVTFNYDRCIEHYLYHALQLYYSIQPQEAAEILKRLQVFHAYGTVGTLEWMGGQSTIEFGASPNTRQLVDQADLIKTFTEGTDPSSTDIVEIRKIMATAKRTVFLGFAFHRLNMDLLYQGAAVDSDQNARKVFATAMGLSASDSDDIRETLGRIAGLRAENVRIRNDLACSGLFREFWRSLALV